MRRATPVMHKFATQAEDAVWVPTARTSSPPAKAPLDISVYSADQWPDIARVWTELANISPYSSFYLSTEWTAAWLETFGKALKPELLVFKEAGQPMGACLLISIVERRGPFRVVRI